jgi:hypothetical protein
MPVSIGSAGRAIVAAALVGLPTFSNVRFSQGSCS